MLFQGHVLMGLVVYLATSPFFAYGSDLGFFLMMMLGALLPDIDEEKSIINRWSGIVGQVVGKIFPHRGFLHSLLFFFILYVLCAYFWNYQYGIALLLGYLAHILADGISLRGVRVFYPLRFKIKGPMKVGGPLEKMITVLLFLVIIKLIWF